MGVGMVEVRIDPALAVTAIAPCGDDQAALAQDSWLVLTGRVFWREVEGTPDAHDLVDPGLHAAGYAEVVHGRRNHQAIRIEQLVDQRIAERQVRVHCR